MAVPGSALDPFKKPDVIDKFHIDVEREEIESTGHSKTLIEKLRDIAINMITTHQINYKISYQLQHEDYSRIVSIDNKEYPAFTYTLQLKEGLGLAIKINNYGTGKVGTLRVGAKIPGGFIHTLLELESSDGQGFFIDQSEVIGEGQETITDLFHLRVGVISLHDHQNKHPVRDLGPEFKKGLHSMTHNCTEDHIWVTNVSAIRRKHLEKPVFSKQVIMPRLSSMGSDFAYDIDLGQPLDGGPDFLLDKLQKLVARLCGLYMKNLGFMGYQLSENPRINNVEYSGTLYQVIAEGGNFAWKIANSDAKNPGILRLGVKFPQGFILEMMEVIKPKGYEFIIAPPIIEAGTYGSSPSRVTARFIVLKNHTGDRVPSLITNDEYQTLNCTGEEVWVQADAKPYKKVNYAEKIGRTAEDLPSYLIPPLSLHAQRTPAPSAAGPQAAPPAQKPEDQKGAAESKQQAESALQPVPSVPAHPEKLLFEEGFRIRYLPNRPKQFQVDTRADGSCFFYACFYELLKVLNNDLAFHKEFTKFFGEFEGANEAEMASKEALKEYDGSKEFIDNQDPNLEVLVDIFFRQRLVNFIKDHRKDYEELKFTESGDFDGDMRRMSRPKTWAGLREVDAASKFLEKNIVVYHDVQGELQVLFSYTDPKYTSTIDVVMTHNMGGKGYNHYNCLLEPQFIPRRPVGHAAKQIAAAGATGNAAPVAGAAAANAPVAGAAAAAANPVPAGVAAAMAAKSEAANSENQAPLVFTKKVKKEDSDWEVLSTPKDSDDERSVKKLLTTP